MKANDINSNEIKIGDIVQIADNPMPSHKWLHEGNKLRVISIKDRSFSKSDKYIVLFLETISGNRRLSHGIRDLKVRLIDDKGDL